MHGAAGGEVICNSDAQLTLAVIPDHHGGLRVAVHRARPLDPEVDGVAFAGADEPGRADPGAGIEPAVGAGARIINEINLDRPAEDHHRTASALRTNPVIRRAACDGAGHLSRLGVAFALDLTGTGPGAPEALKKGSLGSLGRTPGECGEDA